MIYEEMSDRDINVAVARELFPDAEEVLALEVGTVEAQVIIKMGVEGYILDYCNNWADAGPVIADNAIDIQWPEDWLESVGQCTKYLEGKTDIAVEFTDKAQGLRSAMIVLLMARDELT